VAHPIILHHFDQSPFSEKIRVVLGFKRLAWQSVRCISRARGLSSPPPELGAGGRVGRPSAADQPFRQ
jgi:hypothetical protein